MAETRARDLADLGGDATGLATDAELSSGLASKLDKATGYAYAGTLYYTSSGTFTKADPFGSGDIGLRAIRVRLCGGGGGGGGVPAQAGAAGGGGGGGAYAESFLTNIGSLASSETVTVGGLGSGGAAGSNAGSTGGTTSFGSLVSANGGGGGPTSPTSATNRRGGDGGTGASSASGDFVILGGRGGTGLQPNSAIPVGGHGGSSFLGTLGGMHHSDSGIAYNAPGIPAAGYGAGGSAASSVGNSRAGGNGAPGIVIVDCYV